MEAGLAISYPLPYSIESNITALESKWGRCFRPGFVALIRDENEVNQTLQKGIIPDNEISEYDFKMPQSMLIDMFREIGIPTNDVLPAVLAEHRCLYMNDTHWTPQGHELAASVILEQPTAILAGMKA